TPARANALIEDVAREMRGEHEGRELHLELDPAHLGPIVVKLVLKHGKLAASVITRDAEAKLELEARSDELHTRLSNLGFAAVDVSVDQDTAAFAPAQWVPEIR
ncbi:MAG: flagellar hook-length control protein FliK, partial [Thermoleophilia bacterium]|nr:flagellar hook-length control protein FliK [Thermoleophilia bacterium]